MSTSLPMPFPSLFVIFDIYSDLTFAVMNELDDGEVMLIVIQILGSSTISCLYDQEPNLYGGKLRLPMTKRKPREPVFERPKKLSLQDHANINYFFRKNRKEIIDSYNKARNFLEQKDPRK